MKTARYRKIAVRTWADERFQQLSAPPPCGQFLWFYLLTNPDTVNVPGLYRAGESGMAEALRWPLKGFREAFAEACGQALVKADWQARVVWVPKAIRYNEPESPNVVRSWRIPWDEIPECPLKAEAYQHLKAFLEGKGEAFAEAFTKACRHPSSNQEQEQEQEQEKEIPPGPLALGGNGKARETPAMLLAAWNEHAPHLRGVRELNAGRVKRATARLRERPLADWIAVIRAMDASPVCRGPGRSWADFDFLLQDGTATKVLEGKYEHEWGGNGRGASKPTAEPHYPDLTDELRAMRERDAAQQRKASA